MGLIAFWTKHWWWLALPALLAGLGFAYVSPALNAKFFCEGENSCFREWVGALSGWAAAAIALPTIFAIKKQLAQANRHHRENARLQMLGRINMAKRMRYIIRAHLDDYHFENSRKIAKAAVAKEHAYLSSPGGIEIAIREMSRLAELLQRSVYDEYENYVGSGAEEARSLAIELALKSVDRARAHAEGMKDPKIDPYSYTPTSVREDLGYTILSTIREVTNYRTACAKSAHSFLSDPDRHWSSEKIAP